MQDTSDFEADVTFRKGRHEVLSNGEYLGKKLLYMGYCHIARVPKYLPFETCVSSVFFKLILCLFRGIFYFRTMGFIMKNHKTRNSSGLLFDITLRIQTLAVWWFQIFFTFIPSWGHDPMWLIFFQRGWNHQLARVGLMVLIPSEKNRNVGVIPFLGHTWILRVIYNAWPDRCQILLAEPTLLFSRLAVNSFQLISCSMSRIMTLLGCPWTLVIG